MIDKRQKEVLLYDVRLEAKFLLEVGMKSSSNLFFGKSSLEWELRISKLRVMREGVIFGTSCDAFVTSGQTTVCTNCIHICVVNILNRTEGLQEFHWINTFQNFPRFFCLTQAILNSFQSFCNLFHVTVWDRLFLNAASAIASKIIWPLFYFSIIFQLLTTISLHTTSLNILSPDHHSLISDGFTTTSLRLVLLDY